ncbi:family 2 glycosyl transferase [Flammeovirgaceae bacterium 311]|nr:family 2 glycosyl transferase [Flammeovirgaceae bacterium 311]
MIPPFGKRWLKKAGLLKDFIPEPGQVYFGDLNRLKPFNNNFGYERGGPIDRYYIESFFQQESASIKGRVLDIGDNEYTMRYGGAKVTQSDILHIDSSNPRATFVGDLSNAPHIPDNLFDCIILAQTLHLIYDFKGAIRTCHRLLKPGGTLLLTVPYITSIDEGAWNSIWYWAFTRQAMQKLMEEEFPSARVEVSSKGNVYAATAFLYGMGLSEVDKQKLSHQDPQIQMVVSVKAVKA